MYTQPKPMRSERAEFIMCAFDRFRYDVRHLQSNNFWWSHVARIHRLLISIISFYCFLSMNCSRFYANWSIIYITQIYVRIATSRCQQFRSKDVELKFSCFQRPRRTYFNTLHNRRSFMSIAFINTAQMWREQKNKKQYIVNQFGYVEFYRIESRNDKASAAIGF